MTKISKAFQFGDHKVVLEVGEIARQASSAVMVRMGDTVVLVTVVGVQSDQKDRDFFPLTVNYQERTYAAGKIPGGFLKREGRPSEKEVLTSRLIDRPLRPLFPAGFTKEVQIVATVMSLDPEINSDIPAIIGASAALAVSGIPFSGPIGAARVGYRDGAYLLNPGMTQLDDSDLDLVVAGTDHAVLMVESEAAELSEEVMLGAVKFGHEQMQVAIKAVNELAKEVGNPPWDWTAPELSTALVEQVTQKTESAIREAYEIREKAQRREKLAQIAAETVAALCVETEDAPDEAAVKNIVSQIEERVVRTNIINGHARIDGRDTKTIRPITVSTGVLPRTHGSALFTRGETQAIVVATLGTERDSQLLDELTGERKDTFMLHYNFPPYSVGETGMLGSPKRREIGHGRLARRALEAVLPSMEEFPYVIRIVSEITESNGSSSMASVCGGSLALMDAGVPITAPVAGIAMGLIKEGDKFAVLSDILGDEDHLGDMDFKVAGTEAGVTALQMDIKIQEGLTFEIMQQALDQAKEGRLHILNIMNTSIKLPRAEVSNFAPRITTMQIKTDKIRDVIGKGGVVIRQLIEETGALIDISDDGTVKISAVDNNAAAEARRRIEEIVADVEIGGIYEGTVVKIMDFGAFVAILNNKQGLVHISQICQERVENVRDKLVEGQSVTVKVLEIDRQGKIRLSMKEAVTEQV